MSRQAPPSMAGYSGIVTLYCSMQEEEIQAIKEGFEAKYPQLSLIHILGWTVERLIVRFLEWLVDPETQEEAIAWLMKRCV